jgi:hypothetical protein
MNWNKAFLLFTLCILLLNTDFSHAQTIGDACSSEGSYVQESGDQGEFLLCDGDTLEAWMKTDNATRRITIEKRFISSQGIIIGDDTGACSAISDAGTIRYDNAANLWEYCDGSSWLTFGAVPDSFNPNGYFVGTQSSWNGNLGGLSGADSKCLTELQTYDWRGKDEVGLLTQGRVKAFLCDSSTCNNLLANTVYQYARANDLASGGVFFRTDSSGKGPNDSYTTDGTSEICKDWECPATFNFSSRYWTGRDKTTSNHLWELTPEGTNHCNDWASSSSGEDGLMGNHLATDEGRWSAWTSTCNNTRNLICIVHP